MTANSSREPAPLAVIGNPNSAGSYAAPPSVSGGGGRVGSRRRRIERSSFRPMWFGHWGWCTGDSPMKACSTPKRCWVEGY